MDAGSPRMGPRTGGICSCGSLECGGNPESFLRIPMHEVVLEEVQAQKGRRRTGKTTKCTVDEEAEIGQVHIWDIASCWICRVELLQRIAQAESAEAAKVQIDVDESDS